LELRVFLAGGVAVETDGVVIGEDRFPGRQGRLLFAYLVLEQARPVPRDELAEALWKEAPPASWDKALTVLASKLRALLTELGSDGAIKLTGAFGCYRLDLPEGTWVDVLAAVHAAQEAEAADDLEEAKAAAMRAASLARRPFLPGEEGNWVEERRRELTDIRSRALGCLVDASLGLGDAPAAATWAEEAIALEPFREAGYRRLMKAHAAAGNRAEARSRYTSGVAGFSRRSSAPTRHPRRRRSIAGFSKRLPPRREPRPSRPRPYRRPRVNRSPPPRLCSLAAVGVAERSRSAVRSFSRRRSLWPSSDSPAAGARGSVPPPRTRLR